MPRPTNAFVGTLHILYFVVRVVRRCPLPDAASTRLHRPNVPHRVHARALVALAFGPVAVQPSRARAGPRGPATAVMRIEGGAVLVGACGKLPTVAGAGGAVEVDAFAARRVVAHAGVRVCHQALGVGTREGTEAAYAPVDRRTSLRVAAAA